MRAALIITFLAVVPAAPFCAPGPTAAPKIDAFADYYDTPKTSRPSSSLPSASAASTFSIYVSFRSSPARLGAGLRRAAAAAQQWTSVTTSLAVTVLTVIPGVIYYQPMQHFQSKYMATSDQSAPPPTPLPAALVPMSYSELMPRWSTDFGPPF